MVFIHDEKTLEKVQERLGYHFADIHLLQEALTHPSVKGKTSENLSFDHYERFEFLGDAVLGLVIAEALIRKYPDESEGSLAKRHAGLVCGETLTRISADLGIGQFLMMTFGERQAGGGINKANLENALEALIGGIYLDSGLESARQFINRHWQTAIETMKFPPLDPKTNLQEWAQKRGKAIPQYVLISQDGPPHSPVFTMEVRVEGLSPAQASGLSKRLAEREAAAQLLGKIQNADTTDTTE